MIELLAATGDGIARIRPYDGGWQAEIALAGSGASSLAVDPTDPSIVYTGCHGAGVWKSDDGGSRWENLHVPNQEVYSVAVSAADRAVYAGCEPSMLFRSERGGRGWEELAGLRAIPSAPSWSFPPRPWTSHVRWIAPNPSDAALLLVGIELGGVMRTDDGGETWDDHCPGAQRDAHAIAWHPQATDRAYEAAGGGAAWSFNRGSNWLAADAGRDRHYVWALAVDPEDPDRWYVSASPGPMYAHGSRSAEAYLYRWEGEGPFEVLGGGLPQPLDSMPYALAASTESVFAGLRDGRLFRSDDHGETWSPLKVGGEQVPSVLALSIAETG